MSNFKHAALDEEVLDKQIEISNKAVKLDTDTKKFNKVFFYYT